MVCLEYVAIKAIAEALGQVGCQASPANQVCRDSLESRVTRAKLVELRLEHQVNQERLARSGLRATKAKVDFRAFLGCQARPASRETPEDQAKTA